MQPITNHLARIDDVIIRIEDVMEGAKGNAWSSKVNVDKKEIYELVDEIKAVLSEVETDLPTEILKAKRVVQDSEKLIEDAKSKAALIIRNAESEVEKRVAENEIVRQALIKGDSLVEDAKKYARELRSNALQYTDEKLLEMENVLKESLAFFNKSVRQAEASYTQAIDQIYDNRQELRGNGGK
ncbi:MAG: hypothetical protein FWC95_08545 [Defluviitaleaceae bacterium]|nr:hypothetical protein [Defluviitaleaceae bacterium]